MKSNYFIIVIFISLFNLRTFSQNDLNNITNSAGTVLSIKTSSTPLNAPVANENIAGIQGNWNDEYKWQIINVHSTDNFYLRRFVTPNWSNYFNIWHSGNLNTESTDFNSRTLFSKQAIISTPSSANYINAMTIDVGSFGTDINAANSHFFRNRVIGTDGDTVTMFIIKGNGNVGIGTHTPNAKLDVRGRIRADEIIVNLNHGADFVFDCNYKLLPINELENFINKNRHLPDIASAKEMEKNGISISEMNISLLRKIEEQSLYIIELNKRINILEKLINKE